MAAAGYMTIAETRSIWETALGDSTRFDYINDRFAEILNFHLRPDHDATTNITNTKVIPILEHLSEEGLIELISSAKTVDHPIPVEYIASHAVSIMSSVLRKNYWTIRTIKEVLEAKVIVKYSNKLNLPSHSD